MQDFELWWLLVFPVFFGLGWFAARVDMRAVLGQAKAIPAAYFKTLLALVNNHSDRAVEALTKEQVKGDDCAVLQRESKQEREHQQFEKQEDVAHGAFPLSQNKGGSLNDKYGLPVCPVGVLACK